MPTYKHGHTIARALDSILAEPGAADVEIVVSNNASTDGTAEILTRYAAAHPNIRVLTQPKPVDFNESLARAMEACRGTYTWLMSSDDALVEGALGRVLGAIRSRTQPAILLGNWWIADGALRPIRTRRTEVADRLLTTPAQAMPDAAVWGLFMSVLVFPTALARPEVERYRHDIGLLHWKIATRLVAGGQPVLALAAPLVWQRWPDTPVDYDIPFIFGELVHEQTRALRRDARLARGVARAAESAILQRIVRGFVLTARQREPEVAGRWLLPLARCYWTLPAFWIWIASMYAIPRGVLGWLWPFARGLRDRAAALRRGGSAQEERP